MHTDVKSNNRAWIDGSSTGLYGYYLESEKKVFVVRDHPCTNNKAEWLSLYTLLVDLPDGWEGKVFADSMLIVNQFNGKFRVKDPELQRFFNLCKTLVSHKELKMELMWTPRKHNLFGKVLEKELRKERQRKWAGREQEQSI